MMYVDERQFLRRQEVIEKLANGAMLAPPLVSANGPDVVYALQCCICEHSYSAHDRPNRPEESLVARNGCRCCARSTVIPVTMQIAGHPVTEFL